MTNSNYVRDAVQDWVWRGAAMPAAITNRFMRLWTVMPDHDGSGGTEVSGGAYTALNLNSAFGTNAVDGVISNDAIIEFLEATADWGTIAGWTVEDAASGGNMLKRHQFSQGITIITGQQFKYPISVLTSTQK